MEIDNDKNELKELYRKLYALELKVNTLNEKLDSIYQCTLLVNHNINRNHNENKNLLQYITNGLTWIYNYLYNRH